MDYLSTGSSGLRQHCLVKLGLMKFEIIDKL